MDSLKTLQSFKHGKLYSLPALGKALDVKVERLPVSIRIVLESVLRNCDGKKVTEAARARARRLEARSEAHRGDSVRAGAHPAPGLHRGAAALRPRRDAQRGAEHGQATRRSSSRSCRSISWSTTRCRSTTTGAKNALDLNMKLEFKRNEERYQFMKWGMQAFDTFKVVPPGIGIVHQVNLEYLARGVHKSKDGVCYPDTLVGTDSHTTMINGIGVVGWGVGGIEAEAGMLGQPVYFLTPDVVGVHLKGKLHPACTATDLVLTVTELLRKAKVVGKFVEFFGEGAASLRVPDRATIGNMAPEYGATMGFFPVDDRTVEYFRGTGRTDERSSASRPTSRRRGCSACRSRRDRLFAGGRARPLDDLPVARRPEAAAGPHRPRQGEATFQKLFSAPVKENGFGKNERRAVASPTRPSTASSCANGDVLIAAITSCTNTSNPGVLLAAGLLAKKAVELGLSGQAAREDLARPGSRVVTEYLQKAGLLPYLEKLGFAVAAYGCTTCIGNAGPLAQPIEEAIIKNDLVCAAVLSGNRNFEARIHPNIRANFLASPPLVVAYAIAGTVDLKDLRNEPLGKSKDGKDVFIGHIWPSADEVRALMKYAMDPARSRGCTRTSARPTRCGRRCRLRRARSTAGRSRPTSPSRRSSRTSR